MLVLKGLDKNQVRQGYDTIGKSTAFSGVTTASKSHVILPITYPTDLVHGRGEEEDTPHKHATCTRAACTTLTTLPLSEHHETAVLVALGGLSESWIHTHRTGILLHISLHLQNLDSMSEGYELSHGVHFQERYRNCSASSSRLYNKLKWRLNHRATSSGLLLWHIQIVLGDISHRS